MRANAAAANDEPPALGGKASALLRLERQGFDVPSFLVVDSGFEQREGDLATALARDVPRLGPGPYAARSSAVGEDGAEASHAGQYLSLLNLSLTELPEAVERVRQSGLAASVADYRSSRGMDGQGVAPAVIVQQMVRARCAGVMFTADPVTGRRDRIIVSAVAGLGDRLVGGEEDGQSFRLARDGGDVIAQPADPVLSPIDLAALYRLALAVEQASDGPQDIEWAFEDHRLFLLQARPITTALRPMPLADPAVTVLDNSNIIESYPGLVSPLTFSFAQYAYSRVYRTFADLVGVDRGTIARDATVFDNLLARVDARVYYNLGNWYRALALLPGFAGNRANMELMMGVDEPLPAELVEAMPPIAGSRLTRAFALTAMSLRLGWAALRLGRTRQNFYARVDAALSRPAAALQAMPLTVLATEYRHIEAELLDRWDAPLINDFLCMIAFGASRRLMQKWGGEAGLALHTDIMIGQGDIISAEPAQRIRAMGRLLGSDNELREGLARGEGDRLVANSALAQAVSDYLQKFADRCAEELKLESLSLDSDPAPLYKAIAAAAPSNAAAVERRAAGASLHQLFAGRPLRRFIAASVLGVAKRRVRDRENLRFERTRIFGRGRRLFRAIGAQLYANGLIDSSEDVFMLTLPEVLGAIEGSGAAANLMELCRLRRAETAASATRRDPPSRLLLRGAVMAGLENIAMTEERPRDSAAERLGVGCSAGIVTARACVVRDPRTQSLARGDVLVARHTDPGWIALFTNASAIVVERGSPLSHSAIVARELGIPCVVALKDAMSWIADGETIEVNGSSGLVRRL